MKNYVYLCPVEKQLTTFAHENNLAFRDTHAVRDIRCEYGPSRKCL